MGYARTSLSLVETTSKSLPSALTALPSAKAYRANPSTQLRPLRPEVSMRVRCLMTHTTRPSSPRVSIRSVSMENPDV